MLGDRGKCPVQESHGDVLQAEPGPAGSLTELCLHAVPGHFTSGRKAEHVWEWGSSAVLSHRVAAQTYDLRPRVAKGCARGGAGPGEGESEREPRPGGEAMGLWGSCWSSPARPVAVLLGPGQGLQQHAPPRQQHVLVKQREQLPQRLQQLHQGSGELDLKSEHRDRRG